MRVTVKDCMALSTFKGAVVLAGKQNTGNVVKSVSVMDVQSPEDAVRTNGVKNRLVLTSFSGVSDIKDKLSILRALADAGVAGIVLFKTDAINAGTRDDLRIVCNEGGISVISIAEESKVTYADVIEQIMDELRYGDNFKNDLISNTIYHLLDFERHSSFQSALKEAAVNNSFQVVLLSRDFNPVFAVETRQQATIDEVIRMGKKQDFDRNGIYTLVTVNGVLTYWGPITVNEDSYFLFIVDNEDNYSVTEISKLAEIIEIAMGMWKYTPERDVKAEIVKALIRDNKSLAYTLKDELELNPEGITSVFYAREIDNDSMNDAIANFEETCGMQVLRITDRDETYGVVLAVDESLDKTQAKINCNNLYGTLKEIDKRARIFHATGINGIEGAGDAFKLIGETWTFVEGVFPYKRVFTRYELALVSNCINLQVTGGYLRKVYMDLLEPIHREMGENKARQLLETLETFILDAGMNSSKTSEFMGIHANTVQYRLKRLNEVLGAEITGNRVIPGLTMALALKRLERVVK